MNLNKWTSDAPIRLTGARAWRTYLGGRLIDDLHGEAEGEDGQFPEEWIASLVSARNAGREEMEEGLSMIAADPAVSLKEVIESEPEKYLGEGHVKLCGPSTGVLVKLIDAAERLTVQVHPDREQAEKLFQSRYGKTECWHILGGREIDGEKPCVYLGFREGVTRRRWKELFERQDISGMLDCLHRFEVKAGDTVFIQGGIPHAIGAGCFLTEIQEPTDLTIRVERTTPSGFQVDDFMCHQGLGFERMLDCFHYGGLSEEETRRRWFIKPENKLETDGGRIAALIGEKNTSYFSMDIIEVTGEMSVTLPPVFSGLYVLEGRGFIGKREWEPIRQGESFFVPAGTGEFMMKSEEGAVLRVIHFFGPRAESSGTALD